MDSVGGCACVASVMRSAQNCVCASAKWLKCVCVCVCTLWRVYEDFPPLVQTDLNELIRLMKCHRLKKIKMAHLSFSPLLHQSSLKPLPNRKHMLTYMHPYLYVRTPFIPHNDIEHISLPILSHVHETLSYYYPRHQSSRNVSMTHYHAWFTDKSFPRMFLLG